MGTHGHIMENNRHWGFKRERWVRIEKVPVGYNVHNSGDGCTTSQDFTTAQCSYTIKLYFYHLNQFRSFFKMVDMFRKRFFCKFYASIHSFIFYPSIYLFINSFCSLAMCQILF